MSEDYRDLEHQMRRMTNRRERVIKANADYATATATLKAVMAEIIAEVDTEIQAMQLELTARRASGENDE